MRKYPTMIDPEKVEKILTQYYTFGRSYHGETHVLKMLDDLNMISELTREERLRLELAILFHDAGTTEKESCGIFSEWFPNDPDTEIVCKLIMATRDHDYTGVDKLTKIILDLDLAILRAPMIELLDYEHGIFKEYQRFSIDDYIKGRTEFLENIKGKIKVPHHLDELITYVKTRLYRIGIYPGSFNPFQSGHQDIVLKAEQIFDKVVIARGINPDKTNKLLPMPRSLPNEMIEYSGLVTELFPFNSLNIKKFFVRGLRNVYDIGYEENLRKTVYELNPRIEFVYFFCDYRLEHISSSMLRGMMNFPSAKEMLERHIIK